MENNTPILVGSGQFTQKTDDPAKALPPMGLAAEAAKRALDDTGVASSIVKVIDALAVVRIFPDSSNRPRLQHGFGRAENPPRAVARRIGADPAVAIYSHVGGDCPQKLVNEMAERIAAGEVEVALLAGAECSQTMRAAHRAGIKLNWQEEDSGSLEDRGLGSTLATPHEFAHGIGIPVQTYPLFENAIRGKLGRTVAEHMLAMGRLFEPFTKVAAKNPYAYFPTVRSAEELATVTPENRFIGFPYPKWMNANDNIDQAAALVMTSVGRANELGIDPAKWIFIHGCGEASETKLVSQRVSYTDSPAIKVNTVQAFAMAGLTIDDMDFIDIYSCFPSAVEVACAALGLACDDPRGLTVTGGLPFFGGPGNNYSMHAIAEMMRRLRARPGSYGLVTANGGYISKHATGIYSTRPTPGSWSRVNPSSYQAVIDAMPSPPFEEAPDGPAKVETFTVVYGRSGPERGIVIGRLDANGHRFIANTPVDPAIFKDMVETEYLNRAGRVSSVEGVNTFVPA